MLITKLLPPRYHQAPLLRERLLDRLNNVAYQRLIHLRAPGGFGKTTLLTQWRKVLIEQGHKVGWINLDESDSEESQFLGYWVAALKQADCPVPQQLMDTYERGRPESLDNFLTVLVNVLAEFEHELYLILDDYHCIDNPRIHELLGRMVKYAPANFHLVITSRTELPACLEEPRQKSRGNELNVRSLRFSESETQAFLAERMAIPVSAESCRALFEATEGWIAGIQMLAMSNELKDPDLADWNKGLYPLAETILESTLSNLPRDTQDLLLRLSVLDRFNVELCEEVLGVRNAQHMLESLAADGLLLVPLDHDEQWYRFHALFSEHLRQRLAKRVVASLGDLHQRAQRWLDTESAQTRPSLSSFLRECKSELNAIDLPSFHYRASLWFERKGHLVEAVQHALASEGEERAYDLIDRCVMNVLATGDLNTILAWTDKVPAAELARRWHLRVARFWAMVLGGLHLQNARQELHELNQAVGIVGGISAFEYQVCLRTFDALSGDSLSTLELLNHWPPSGDIYHNGVACNALIYALATASRFDDVPNILVHHPEPPPSATRGFTYAYRQSIIGWVQFLKGNLAKASSSLSEALQRLDESFGRRSAPSCVVSGYLAESLYESNDLGALKALLSGRLEVMNERVFFESYIRSLLAGARLQHLQGNDDAAHELLERLRLFGQSTDLHRPVAAALAERIRLLLLAGDPQGARRLQTQLEQLAASYDAPLTPAAMGSTFDIPVLALLARARCALNEGDAPEALDQLDRLSGLTAELRLDYFIKVRLLRCLALYQLDDPDWPDALRQLLEVSARCQMIRSVCDEGLQSQQMLQAMAGKLSTPALEEHLANILGGFQQARQAQPSRQHTEYNLSGREQDILELLVQGMPNKRIAQALNISAETVKWYLKKLFAKLNVSDRVHAIDKARREKLVCDKGSG
ncbi:LuxR C-terminal-related transcriptional regulator [Pseudomonas chengduensis]|uniref:LuxR family transcriptional regulator, maltose regulon positive regulatory protein n=1 Tax=Pseudomonas sihuiensis TaxID=1274359 RepID=A0A1H2LTJ1_9PSED|nr:MULTISPECIES: LuxR C-terminal-related transcriptional regulator [Pseudomonas]MDH1684083.1 LuxR C-terminal-related transcriptional regulator [Pseudomonas chengduensis]SDU84045.1 LuxR family transcriptional regulator, maltose regulon positive regulatory protein [Pseudomonas sihuiensis]